MTARIPVLFVSNGYGEDAIAGGIVESLQATAPHLRILAMPLVGQGKAYSRLGVEVVGPQVLLPSGGLILSKWTHIFSDLRAGLWGVTWRQIQTIRTLRPVLGAFVAVGDTYPVVLGGLFSGRRVIMVGTAKSNYFCPYSWPERFIFRRTCEVVFARDEPTAATLRRQGVAARWVGNGMMDLVRPSADRLPLPTNVPCIAILPGSRESAYRDLPVLLDAVRRIGAERSVAWVMALADSVDLQALGASAAVSGFTLDARPAGDGCEGWLRGHGQDVLLARGRFGDVLEACVMVMGQAGTGNEQAVGVGRPVVSFDSDGRVTPGWYRARQIGLLGGSMAVVARSGAAIRDEVLAILSDTERYARMQQIGYERMGPAGASAHIAAHVAEHATRVGAQGQVVDWLSGFAL